MRERFITILITFLSVLILTGCHNKSDKPDLEVVPHDDNTITITADKAGISGIGGAGITITDAQQLVIDSALSKGSIQLKLFLDNEPAGVDASLDEILHTDETPALDVTVNSRPSIRFSRANTRSLSMCWRRLPETSRSVRSNLPPLKFDAVQ